MRHAPGSQAAGRVHPCQRRNEFIVTAEEQREVRLQRRRVFLEKLPPPRVLLRGQRLALSGSRALSLGELALTVGDQRGVPCDFFLDQPAALRVGHLGKPGVQGAIFAIEPRNAVAQLAPPSSASRSHADSRAGSGASWPAHRETQPAAPGFPCPAARFRSWNRALQLENLLHPLLGLRIEHPDDLLDLPGGETQRRTANILDERGTAAAIPVTARPSASAVRCFIAATRDIDSRESTTDAN